MATSGTLGQEETGLPTSVNNHSCFCFYLAFRGKSEIDTTTIDGHGKISDYSFCASFHIMNNFTGYWNVYLKFVWLLNNGLVQTSHMVSLWMQHPLLAITVFTADCRQRKYQEAYRTENIKLPAHTVIDIDFVWNDKHITLFLLFLQYYLWSIYIFCKHGIFRWPSLYLPKISQNKMSSTS